DEVVGEDAVHRRGVVGEDRRLVLGVERRHDVGISQIGRAHVCTPVPQRSTLFPYTTLFRSRMKSSARMRSIVAASLAKTAAWYSVSSAATTSASRRSEEHTSALQSHRDLHSFPTRRSSDLG